MRTVFPVVLSGGSGTRLWPLSRVMYPKQFIDFLDHGGTSCLAATLERLRGHPEFAAPIVVCNNDHRFLVKAELARTAFSPGAIILEPVARNTAAAIAVAALQVASRDPGGILLVMPADHVIRDDVGFIAAVGRAVEVAATGRLVLFGIEPREPHTGYGYIRRGAVLPGFDGAAFAVDGFFEKPDAATARSYIERGGHYWNSGIFVLHAEVFLAELERLQPRVLEAARRALAVAESDLGFLRLDAAAFARSPDISVDHAVMEHTSKAAVLPIDVGWSDIGSWASLWDVSPRDADGNHSHGDTILRDTRDSYIHSERALVATIGVDGLVIVDTPDALLVADKSRSQEVSHVVAELRRAGRKEYQQHLKNHRPWGYFETLNIGPRFQVKLLHVEPGGKLSMQMHHHRSEHWVVVHGTAKVTRGEVEEFVRENESVYIVAGQWHRLENPGRLPLQLIEVQIGSYLGEDDIIRTDDVYKRDPGETK